MVGRIRNGNVSIRDGRLYMKGHFQINDIVIYIGNEDDSLRGKEFKVVEFFSEPAIMIRNPNMFFTYKYKFITPEKFAVISRASIFKEHEYEYV